MNHGFPVLIGKDKIALRVKEMAGQLAQQYQGRPLVVVGLMSGVFIFMADLVRAADFAAQTGFYWLESYQGTQSTGHVRVKQDLNIDVSGKSVLIVDDILDTGGTLRFAREKMLEKGAVSVEAAVLLRKENNLGDPELAEYIGFPIPNEFVIGYGLDFDGQYRHLPDICILPDDRKP